MAMKPGVALAVFKLIEHMKSDMPHPMVSLGQGLEILEPKELFEEPREIKEAVDFLKSECPEVIQPIHLMSMGSGRVSARVAGIDVSERSFEEIEQLFNALAKAEDILPAESVTGKSADYFIGNLQHIDDDPKRVATETVSGRSPVEALAKFHAKRDPAGFIENPLRAVSRPAFETGVAVMGNYSVNPGPDFAEVQDRLVEEVTTSVSAEKNRDAELV